MTEVGLRGDLQKINRNKKIVAKLRPPYPRMYASMNCKSRSGCNGACPSLRTPTSSPNGAVELVVPPPLQIGGRPPTPKNIFSLSLTHSVIHFCSHLTFSVFRSHNGARASCLGRNRPVRQTARNRLKIGARREGTVSDDILETRRLPRTDG